MTEPEESGSLYDFVPSDHQAPVAEKPVREVNWQSANNDKFKQDLPKHVSDAMTVTQKDLSYYAFNRFVFGHPVADSFEQEVNKQFGKLQKGFDFILEREKYITLYRKLMEK